MNGYRPEEIAEAVRDALVHASTYLEPSLLSRLDWMRGETARELDALKRSDRDWNRVCASLQVLDRIKENLAVAAEKGLPMCQDTGMVVACIDIGPDCPLPLHTVRSALDEGISQAVRTGHFRNSVVAEPVFDRINTGTNLPVVTHWQPKETRGLTISLMLKGFGSENCSGVAMLLPTAGEEGVIVSVLDIVRKAGGKPCPPIVVGVGLGGTMERAAQLSKRALFREVGKPNPDSRYAALERKIMEEVQKLRIGPGGFGGPLTALGVAVAYEPTHIAGLPVAVSISCWADRKAIVTFGGDDGTAN